jgi:hypothetical protein
MPEEVERLEAKLARAREVIRTLRWAVECARDSFPEDSGSRRFFNGAYLTFENWEEEFDKS